MSDEEKQKGHVFSCSCGTYRRAYDKGSLDTEHKLRAALSEYSSHTMTCHRPAVQAS